MDNQENEVQKNIAVANTLRQRGDFEQAIASLSAALDILVGEARAYAQISEPYPVGRDGVVSAAYLVRFNEYLKRDKSACMISNNMALLFAQMGNYSSAKIFFEQAIDLTPPGLVYDDPHIGLEAVKNK